MEELHNLHDGLKSSAIQWMNMTQSQLNELDKEPEAHHCVKGGPLKKRGAFSEKGKKQACQEEDDNEDDDNDDEENANAIACPAATTPSTSSSGLAFSSMAATLSMSMVAAAANIDAHLARSCTRSAATKFANSSVFGGIKPLFRNSAASAVFSSVVIPSSLDSTDNSRTAIPCSTLYLFKSFAFDKCLILISSSMFSVVEDFLYFVLLFSADDVRRRSFFSPSYGGFHVWREQCLVEDRM
ncbi:hypothetical protein B0H10DRAFT_2228731 [Mycena sp. CBHHK59/15]|nr:hypothetical protein B0H10DRAFT_2228731 [Mycena sp. CBHHK59/15]